jgi:M6 family metalloprotease-like protein
MRQLRLNKSVWNYIVIALLLSVYGMALPVRALALEPPPPGMIDQMRSDGTLAAALAQAKELGNNQLRVAKRGAAPIIPGTGGYAAAMMQYFGWSQDAQGKAVSELSARQLSPAELDLNYDHVVDERDVLALGFNQPKSTASLPCLGTARTFCLFIDFPDYNRWFTPAQLDFRLFDQGDNAYYYRSLQWYYQQASYNNLTVEGAVYQHRASHNRTYYHPNNSTYFAPQEARRRELLTEAILAADAAGADFSQYDNDGNGVVDSYMVVYCGPVGAWASYWWGYCYTGGYGLNVNVDGVSFNGSVLSWQWEQYYGFGGTPPNPPNWDPLVTIHETGHAIGLPDYYDYDGSVGPDGGVGGLDMMDGNWGDHNCFSKYILGWLAPTVAFTNLDDEPLDRSNLLPDAVIFMPGFDPVSPWTEYFMAQHRFRGGVDQTYPASGILLWHVDATQDAGGNFIYDNSYAAHKLLRLMEADGLEQIEAGGSANAGDYYQPGKELSPTSTPNSNKYDGSNPGIGITCNDIKNATPQMTADFLMYGGGPSSWSVVINFLLQYGAGPFTVELDTDYNGVWDSAPANRVYELDGDLLAPGTQQFTVSGTTYSRVVDIPSRNPSGPYTFAIRVTDLNGAQYVYSWPGTVWL